MATIPDSRADAGYHQDLRPSDPSDSKGVPLVPSATSSLARAHGGASWRLIISVLVAVLVAATLSFVVAERQPVRAATPVTAGYRDHQYGDPMAPGGDDVSAARNQSKLWFHDGQWFAVMFDTRTQLNAKFRIWRFDMATQNWTNTGVAVDDRNRSHMDVLSVGNTLYVVSARAEAAPGTVTGRDLRIYRFSYATATNTYALSPGFPKLIANTADGTGYATIARDDQRLWVAWPQDDQVMVSASSDAAVTWSAPIVLPTMGNPITSDDMVAVAEMRDGAGVGVMWSNQNATDDAFYFSAHVATDPIGTWQARESGPLGSPGSDTHTADGHISLKTDPDGNLLAAVKTDRNNQPGPNGSDPLIALFKRTGTVAGVGAWESHTVTSVSVGGTRPILVIDDAADRANVFLTHPALTADGSQSIFRRSAPLSTLDFGAAAVGELAISSTAETAINDATSTKQVTTAASGLIVAATNIPTLRYLHACIGAVCPVKPVADFTGTPTSGDAPLSVAFTDTSTHAPTTWAWEFGDGATSTSQNPTHQYADPGTYTVKLTASNVAGSSTKTRTSYIDVDVPPENLYVPVPPVRILDTRTNLGLNGTFKASTPRTLDVAGRLGIPADAVAITGNLTVVGQTKGGYLSITRAPTANPTTSTLNFPIGDARANGVTVPLNGSGDVSIVYKASAGATAHVVLDVTGYFRQSTTGASFFSLDPKRVLDSRTNVGLPGSFKANVPRGLPVAGVPGIPDDAIAVTGNLTVVGQTKGGYLSITKTSVANPTTSTLNFPVGDVRANGVTVPLNASGDLWIVYKASAGATAHVVLDITGYFRASLAGASFVPVTPERIVDTRVGNGLSGVFVSGTPRTWDVDGRGGVGSDAIAITGNVTVVGQTKAGYVSVTPTPVASPTTSTLNFPVGDPRANNFVVKVSATGKDSATFRGNGGGTTHLVVDVTGYYH